MILFLAVWSVIGVFLFYAGFTFLFVRSLKKGSPEPSGFWICVAVVFAGPILWAILLGEWIWSTLGKGRR